MASFPGGEEGLVAQVKALNASMAGLQQTIDNLKFEVIESFKTARRLREDEERAIKARIASVGNQVAYLRDNVCHCMNTMVSQNKTATISDMNI